MKFSAKLLLFAAAAVAVLVMLITLRAGVALSALPPAALVIGFIGYCIAAATGLLVIFFAIGNAIETLVGKISRR